MPGKTHDQNGFSSVPLVKRLVGLLGASTGDEHSLAAHIVQAYNRDFIRMQKLKELGEPKFRQDIISGNIVQYILKGMAQPV